MKKRSAHNPAVPWQLSKKKRMKVKVLRRQFQEAKYVKVKGVTALILDSIDEEI